MRREFRILLEIAGDVVVALALTIVACLGSGWCQQHLTPNVDLYLTWFTLWMVPFAAYATWRGAFEQADMGSVIGYVLFIASVQLPVLAGIHMGWVICISPFIFPRAICAGDWLAQRIRRVRGDDVGNPVI